MVRSFILSLSIALAMLLSPESLLVLGGGVGGAGVYFILAISIASVCYIPNIFTQSIAAGAGGETRLLRATFKPLITGTSLIASRVSFTVIALPIIMSSAGFVFNETFLYWFPNFLFAHMILIALALVLIINRRVSEVLQVIFIALVLSGLLFLSIVGFSKAPEAFIAFSPEGFKASIPTMFTALYLFVGFDLMFLSGRKAPEEATSAITSIMIAAMIFTLWGLASFFHVPLEKLSSSSVPYSRAARAVLGETGRLVIGVVLISGALAMANALLMGVGRMMTEMASEAMLPRVFLIGQKRDLLPVIFLASSGVILMLLGYAGEDKLFIFLRAALLLWMLHYALMHASIVMALKKSRAGGILALSVFGLIFFVFAFIFMVIVHDEREALIRYIFYLLASGFALSTINHLSQRYMKH